MTVPKCGQSPETSRGLSLRRSYGLSVALSTLESGSHAPTSPCDSYQEHGHTSVHWAHTGPTVLRYEPCGPSAILSCFGPKFPGSSCPFLSSQIHLSGGCALSTFLFLHVPKDALICVSDNYKCAGKWAFHPPMPHSLELTGVLLT